MPRNPLSFIFRLGKHRSLPFRPLRQLGVETASPSLPLPGPRVAPETPRNIEKTNQSNQMSS
jgi:hypothetical protein